MTGEKIDELSFWVLGITGLALPLVVVAQADDLFGISKITWLRLAGLLLLALAGLRLAGSGRLRLPAGPLAVLILAFIVVISVSALFSAHLPTSLIGMRKRYFGLSTYVALGLVFAGAATVAWNNRRLRTLAWLVVSGASLASLLALLQALGVRWPPEILGVPGGYSTLSNPNFGGIYLAMVLPVAMALVLAEPETRPRVWAATDVALISLGAIGTRSTGAVAGLLAAVIFYLALARPSPLRRRRVPAVVLAVVILVSAAGLAFLSQTEARSMRWRIFVWRGALQLIAENPWRGVGPDMMRFTIDKKVRPTKTFHRKIFEDAHNIFLTTAVTSGLPALALLAAILYMATAGAISNARQTGGTAGPLLYAIAAAIIGYLVAEMVNPDNMLPAAILWLLLGVASGRRWGHRERSVSASAALPLSTAIIAVAVFAGVTAIYPLIAEVHLLRAERTRLLSVSLAELAAAERANPYYDWYSVRITDRLMPLVSPGRPRETALALAAVDRAIAKAPLEADNYVAKGSVYRLVVKRGGDRSLLSQAIKWYRQALSLDPFQLYAMRDLAESYFLLGDRDRAGQWLDRYLALDDSPEIKAVKAKWRL